MWGIFLRRSNRGPDTDLILFLTSETAAPYLLREAYRLTVSPIAPPSSGAAG
jgi:hypothetical protein